MNDYQRIAQLIRYIDSNRGSQPDLETLAQQAGLSASHFHRLFSEWAAITPKDFLQCLTVEHAKRLLREGKSVLDAAHESGLSGPGRLHDLCIQLEAASPGEYKSGGKGLTLTAGFAQTPFGKMLLGLSPRGVCHLSFFNEGEESQNLSAFQEDWPEAQIITNDSAVAETADLIFRRDAHSLEQATLKAFVRGTDFQVRVWRALLNIRPGTLVSYGNLATAVGNPRASRAVGTAVGQNPISYLIPCHRVIRETGVFGNYRWDPIRKRALLAWESAPLFEKAPLHKG